MTAADLLAALPSGTLVCSLAGVADEDDPHVNVWALDPAPLIDELVSLGIDPGDAARLAGPAWCVITGNVAYKDVRVDLSAAGVSVSDVWTADLASRTARSLVVDPVVRSSVQDTLARMVDGYDGQHRAALAALLGSASVVTHDTHTRGSTQDLSARTVDVYVLSDRRVIVSTRSAAVSTRQYVTASIPRSCTVDDLGTLAAVAFTGNGVELIGRVIDAVPIMGKDGVTGYRYTPHSVTVPETVGTSVLLALAELGAQPDLLYPDLP